MRTRIFKRASALLLVLSLLLPAPAAASEALGEEVESYALTLGEDAEYERNIFYGDSVSDFRQEHLVRYSPRSEVLPLIRFGDAVAATAGVSAGAKALEAQGYRVLAGVNGDFYNVGNAVPLGMVVQGGTLYSGSWDYYALGFTEDGELITGKPRLSFRIDYQAFNPDTGETTDLMLPLANYNKDRGDGGVYLYSYDFNRKHTTGTTAVGTDVLLRLTEGRVAIGESAVFSVEQVFTENPIAVTMSDKDRYVLSVNQNAPIGVQLALAALLPGTEVTLSVASQDGEKWNDVQEAVGALYCLLQDGKVSSDIAGQSGSAPRTAVGVKENGDVLFYTIDGRQKGYSMGASYSMVARRLLELGCVEGYALDGGGSTAMYLSEPGYAGALVSRPSDGYERSVSNTLYLVAPQSSATGKGGGLNVHAKQTTLLAGGSTELSAAAYDSAYFPVSSSAPAYSASAGTVSGSVFTAPEKGGTVTVTAKSGSRTGKITLTVVDEPDSISISVDGKAVSRLTLSCGKSVTLSAAALYRHTDLSADASCFSWSLSDESLGSIDGAGRFTAGDFAAEGTLTVTAGKVSRSIPVTLTGGAHFRDVHGTWAESYIDGLYECGVVGGFADGTFRPDASLTRAQFAAMLFRALGLNEADYADAPLPFADGGGLGDYAVTPVKALYALGIVSGTEQNGALYFRGGETLTRAQAAAMLGRAYGLTSEESLSFTDAGSVPAYAVPYVTALTRAGVISGFADGSFAPKRVLTRAQMCKILSLAMAHGI